MRAITLLALGLALCSGSVSAQQNAVDSDLIEARIAEHADDFDYLLGDWEFTATDETYGTYGGHWSAVRLSDGQILDEYSVGDAEETYFVVTTIRAYNALQDRWELIGMGAGDGLQDVGFAERVGDEMHLEQRIGAAGGRPEIWRIRYYDIRPDRFSWSADRSLDDGTTWQRGYMRIEARRIGPAREFGPLASGRPPRTSS